VRAERLIVAPDCGLKYLSRDVAYGKLKAMVAGAAILRAEMAQAPGPVRIPLNS
jgi:5-methyltetrahydropteroyltriglutamate--homocysteine methyltransferase